LGRRKHGRAQHLARDGTTRCLDVADSDAHASPLPAASAARLGTTARRISGQPRRVRPHPGHKAALELHLANGRASCAKTIYVAFRRWSWSIARIKSEDIWS